MNRLFFVLIVWFALSAQELTIKSIMQEPFLWGNRIQGYGFTPDGNHLIYKESGKPINLVNMRSPTQHVVDSLNSLPLGWINDSTLFYRQRGVYRTAELRDDGTIRNTGTVFGSKNGGQYQTTLNRSTELLFQDKLLMIKRNGKLSSIPFPSTVDNDWHSLRGLSADGRFAVMLHGTPRSERQWELYFPNYLPTFTKPGKQNRRVYQTRVILIDLDQLSTETLFTQDEGGWISAIQFNGSSHLAWMDRQINRQNIDFYLYDLKRQRNARIYRSTSQKWVVGRYHRISFSPDNSQMMFVALSDGYERLIVRDLTRNRNQILSLGNYDVTWADWLSNSELIMVTNEDNPTQRTFVRIKTQNRDRTVVDLGKNGYIQNVGLSQNRRFVAFDFSTVATPGELYGLDLQQNKAFRISQTIPEKYTKLNIVPQEIIKTKSSDGKFDIYANFYSSDKQKKPLVVFVHGAGILQNVRNGWTPSYYREFMFHQILIKNGFHVLDVDYRGSLGYSHRFSTDVYSHLGKKELEDIVTFIDLLAKRNLIDRDRVGIYGGSYGGFMAAYAMAFEPDLFKAGAALRSVFKWENYYYTNEWYTRARLGRLSDNPEWYKRSSPVYHADKIKHPLLILHGMLDDNVPFQDAVQMVQEMIDHEKTFDLMIYPKEKHSFRQPKSWVDEYTRIYNYFVKYLKPNTTN